VAAYQQTIQRSEKVADARQVAVGKGQLGTMRMLQGRYSEALAAHAEAREWFTQLNEPGAVAVSWHQTGVTYQEAAQLEEAEDAYRKSLAIEVLLGDVASQAGTLSQLGNLYDLSRPEEAVALYRQAAEKYVEIGDSAREGVVRNNLAMSLRKLGRPDEARQEINRAIKCGARFGQASSPWVSWATLADIETDDGNRSAAAEAKRKAIACYLAYRRDAGENHDAEGRVSLVVTQALLAGDAASAGAQLQELAADPDLPSNALTFVRVLQAIVAGSRDRTLADDPDMNYSMAAEILFLIETLEKAGK
jgi:tetratricopeptide (TPR) repeat protein